jgi:hypothetical protein
MTSKLVKIGSSKDPNNRLLRPYQRRIDFYRNGIEQVANECFACGYRRVHFSLCLSLIGEGIFKAKQWEAGRSTLDKYEFNEV